jgi:hypothetical protein
MAGAEPCLRQDGCVSIQLIRSVLCVSLSQDLLSSLHTEKRGAM